MQSIFSTATIHPRDRFDCWHEVACKQIVGHQSRPFVSTHFDAELKAAFLADTQLLIFRNSPMSVSRTRQDIARSSSDDLFVCRQLAGKLKVEQQGREILLAPREFCLLDPQIPYNGTFGESSKLLVLKVPRRALEARFGNTSALGVRPLNRGAAGRLASYYLASLPACSDNGRSYHALYQDQALDLITVCLASSVAKRDKGLSSPRVMAHLRLRLAIDQHMANPALSPTALAAAAGMSVRYSNLILANQGTSLERFIQTSRLERCRRVLEDPGQAHRSITDVAFAWGFSDLATFSRAFKRAFGQSPRGYRAVRVKG